MAAARAALTVLTVFAAVICSTGPANAETMPWAAAGFCAWAQNELTGTSLPVVNVVNPDRASFIRSKPTVKPLVVQEFHDDQGNPGMVSCKLITAKNLRSVYGSKTANGDRDCRTANALTLAALSRDLAAAGLTPEIVPGNVVLEPDLVAPLGPVWLNAPQRVWRAGERLHVQASAVYADLGDPALANAPASVHGTRNCHLIAPQHLRALLLGKAELPGAP